MTSLPRSIAPTVVPDGRSSSSSLRPTTFDVFGLP